MTTKNAQAMKRVFLFATAALILTGCSEDPFDPGTGDPSGIVTFSTDRTTRGTPIEDVSLLADIGTFGYYTGQSGWTETSLPNRMFNRRLYRDGTSWKYEGSPVQWNGSAASDRFTFYAYAPYAAADNGIAINGSASTSGIPTLTYTVPADVTKQPDLMVAVPRVDIVKPASGVVSLTMEHALTTIGFQVAGDGEQITGFSISGVSMSGTLKIDGSNIVWSDLDTPPTADFSASINFDANQNFYTATPTMSTNLMKGDGYLMMVPQTLDDNAAIVISYADGTSAEINIDPHEWLPGKRIIYELTIVQGGVIIVQPSEVTMPFGASTRQILVECSNLQGNPAPSLPWTLTTNQSWLTLSLSPDGRATANQTVSGEGTQTVYLFSTANGTNADRTAVITLDGTENVVTNVRQLYSAAQGFARSNIVMWIDGNGNKILTFAENEVDHTSPKSVTYHDASTGTTVTDHVPAIPANVQGLHFRWGSLVGVTSNSSPSAFNGSTTGVAPSHTVFWPAEHAPYVPSAWVFNESSASGQVPYASSSDIGANPNSGPDGYGFDAFAGYPGGTGPGFDKAAAKGDICRYISDMGWVRGKWRMPTTAEIIGLLDENTFGGYNGRVVGSWNGSESITNTGQYNRYGYFPLNSARVVGKGLTGNELPSSLLPNPGAARVAFPAGGYRGADGSLGSVGYYAHIWTATPDGSTTARELFWNDWTNYHSYYPAPRTNGFSVRCVLAE